MIMRTIAFRSFAGWLMLAFFCWMFPACQNGQKQNPDESAEQASPDANDGVAANANASANQNSNGQAAPPPANSLIAQTEEFVNKHRELARICEQPTQSKVEKPPTEFEYPAQAFKNTAELNQEWYRFRANCIDEYEAYSEASDDKKKRVREFLERMLRHELVDDDNWREVFQLGSTLIDPDNLESEDPLLAGQVGIAAMWGGDGELAEKLLIHAIKTFPSHRYSARHVCRVISAYVHLTHRTFHPTNVNEVAQMVGNSFHYWLTQDLKATPREHGLVILELKTAVKRAYFPAQNGHPPKRQVALSPAIKFFGSQEGIPPWIKAMLLGMRDFEDAWMMRGQFLAARTDPRRLQNFYRILEASHKQFEAAWEIAPCFSIPAEYMVATSLRDPERRWMWFNKAYEAQDDGGNALRELMHYLVPRWGGSYADMRMVADKIAELGAADANGFAHHVMCYYRLNDEDTTFYQDELLAKQAVQSLDDMIALRDEKSWDFTAQQLRNIKFVFMVKADYDSRSIVDAGKQLGEMMSSKQMVRYGPAFHPEFYFGLHHAKINPDVDQEKNLAAKQACNEFFITELEYENLAPFVKQQLESGAEEERQYWKLLASRLKLIRGFHLDEWQDFDMTCWKLDWGWLTEEIADFSQADRIKLASAPGNPHFIHFNAPLKDYFAIEFDLEFDADYGLRGGTGFEVATATGTSFTVGLNHRPGTLILKKQKFVEDTEFQIFATHEVQKKNRVMIAVYQGRIEIYLNGVFQRTWANPEIEQVRRIAFITNLEGQGCSQTTISRIRLKKLKGEPIPDDAFAKVDYFDAILDTLDHSNAWFQKAKAQLTMTKVDEALDSLGQAAERNHRKDEVSFLRSLIHIHRGEWKEALESLQFAVDADVKFDRRYALLKLVSDNRVEDRLFALALVLLAAPDESLMDEQLYNKITKQFELASTPSAYCQK